MKIVSVPEQNAEPNSAYEPRASVLECYDNATQMTSEWRPNGTNIVTLKEIFRFGLLTESFRDLDQDGFFDLNIKYDAFQNPFQTNSIHLPSGSREKK